MTAARGATRDDRDGAGLPPGIVQMPTHAIPSGCMCTWAVVAPAPGMACISRLTYTSALCPCLRSHAAAAAT